MPNLNFHFVAEHTRVEVDATLLSGGHLNLCLLQLPSSLDAIDGDASRPSAINALRDLLAGGPAHPDPALPQLMPGHGPVLIVAPEYAFGSSDWAAIDVLVRRANRPLVLLAGFGATSARALLDWQAAEDVGGTERHLSWRQDVNPVSLVMRVNGGWCWIHDPAGSTHCLVYLKNVLQQAVEAVQLPDLQTGEIILHLRYGDVDLFPLICADLIQPPAQHPGSPQARIQAILAGVPVERPALVVGSLLQPGFNPNWAIAVDALLNTVLVGRPAAVALCNIAHDRPQPAEEQDKWRSLSGVFAPFGALPKGQADLPAARALNAQGIAGAVVRYTHACATTGVVGWSPYDPVNGVLVWRGNMYCPISAEGLAAPIALAPAAAACEIARFLRRHPPGADTAPRLAEGIAMIDGQLIGADPPTPDAILAATLDGVAVEGRRDPDALADAEVTSALKAGLHALATVRSIEGVSWQAGIGLTGQLRIEGQRRHLLIWRSATESPRSMRRHLANWRLRGGAHPDLVVLGATPMGDLGDGEIVEDRRDDISLAPPAEAALAAGGSLASSTSDITATRALRRVAGLGLSHVASVYADYEQAEDEARVAALLASIGGFFSGRGWAMSEQGTHADLGTAYAALDVLCAKVGLARIAKLPDLDHAAAAPAGAALWFSTYAWLLLWPCPANDAAAVDAAAAAGQRWFDEVLVAGERRAGGRSIDGYLVLALPEPPEEEAREDVRRLELSAQVCRKHLIWPSNADDPDRDTVPWRRVADVTVVGLPNAEIVLGAELQWPMIDTEAKALWEEIDAIGVSAVLLRDEAP